MTRDSAEAIVRALAGVRPLILSWDLRESRGKEFQCLICYRLSYGKLRHAKFCAWLRARRYLKSKGRK